MLTALDPADQRAELFDTGLDFFTLYCRKAETDVVDGLSGIPAVEDPAGCEGYVVCGGPGQQAVDGEAVGKLVPQVQPAAGFHISAAFR